MTENQGTPIPSRPVRSGQSYLPLFLLFLFFLLALGFYWNGRVGCWLVRLHVAFAFVLLKLRLRLCRATDLPHAAFLQETQRFFQLRPE